MPAIAESVDRFEEIVKSHAARRKSSIPALLASLATVRSIEPSGDSEADWDECKDRRIKTRKKLINEFAVSRMSHSYPLISPEMFKLQRHITVEIKNHHGRIVRDDSDVPEEPRRVRDGNTHFRYLDVPLFASVSFFGHRRASIGSVSLASNGFTLSATLPGEITSTLRGKAYAAISRYFAVVAEMVAHPAIAEPLLEDHYFPRTPQVNAIWIPASDALSIECAPLPSPNTKDPAIIIEAFGASFLVGTWIAEGKEDPFEGILREFTSGSLSSALDQND